MTFDNTNARNATFNSDGGIECEYKHPELGWLPYTASPLDSHDMGRELYQYFVDNDLAGAYVPEPEITDPAKAELLFGIWTEAFTAPITAGVSQEERLSWPVKREAAEAQLAGNPNSKQTQMLTLEAAWTGETLDDLATRIVAKSDQYAAIVSAIAGIRRKAAVAFQNGDAEADPFTYDKSMLVAKNEFRNHMWITFGLPLPDVA